MCCKIDMRLNTEPFQDLVNLMCSFGLCLQPVSWIHKSNENLKHFDLLLKERLREDLIVDRCPDSNFAGLCPNFTLTPRQG